MSRDEELSRKRERRLELKYGLSRAEVEVILERIEYGLCDLCGRKPNGLWRKLHIDHDHTTGRVRGLLCATCNSALGFIRDNPVVALRMANYLGGKAP